MNKNLPELPTHELEAFKAVVSTMNFSKAAEHIHITQPALSQRIQSLEHALGMTLFIRDRKGARLTEAGLRLLRYCQLKDHLEEELLNDLGMTKDGKLGGHLRIAAYSSVLTSAIMPSLAELLRENPAIHFEFTCHETKDLPEILEHGEADFIVLDHVLEKNNIEALYLAEEQYILVGNSQFPDKNVFLDCNPEDRLTQDFLKNQGRELTAIKRSYVHSIEGIIKGVELGLGQGVIPKHLLPEGSKLKPIRGLKPLKVPVVLHYYRQPYYSSIQKAVIKTLKDNCKQHL